jgi:hypothetical protein
MGTQVAVLTGDIVNSTEADASRLEAAMDLLADTARIIAGWQSGDARPRFTRFRGDGWQFLVAEPSLALRAACVIVARLRGSGQGLMTRVSIGIGTARHVGAGTLADASGTAFELSGRGLDAMPRRRLLAIAGKGIGPLHHAVVRLVEDRFGLWTPQQAEAIALALDPRGPTMAEIGGVLGISKQAVSYRLSGARAQALKEALALWEKAAREQEAAR